MGILDRFRKPNIGVSTTPASEQTSAAPGLPPAHTLQPSTIQRGGLVMVVGESYYQDALSQVTGGLRPGGFNSPCIAELVPDPTNPYDPAAVIVAVDGLTVGHLSRGDARQYRNLIDRTIAGSGAATVHATITGGWDRGRNDRGLFGVDLHFSDQTVAADHQPASVPQPQPDEIRLRGSATVSVSNEEHYQATLLAATNGTSLEVFTYPALVELVEVPTSPHAKKDSGPVLEVRVGRAAVGQLTSAMSSRFQRVAHRARDEGKRLTCSGSIFQGTKSGAPIVEIRLTACPHARDETHVIDPYFEVVTDRIQSRKTKTLHVIRQQGADGSFRTSCGVSISLGDAILLASTKPSVGIVDPTTRELIEGLDYCERC